MSDLKPPIDSEPDHRRLVPRSFVRIASSFKNPNFRKYMVGQGLSQTGLWMQQTAELWLILELTNSGAALGLHSVLRFGPVLLFGAHGGLLTDRIDRRRLLLITQGLHAAAATTLAIVAWSTVPSLGLVYGVVLVQGIVNAVDNPLRRAFVRDLVTDDQLANAISLKSSVATVTKTLGPALGGFILAAWGTEICFTVNAISYGAVMIALLLIDKSKLRQVEIVRRAPGQLRQGFRYSWDHRNIRILLLLAAVVATFAWNWNIVLPVYASTTFSGDASLYGILVASVGLGSFAGAIHNARSERTSNENIRVSAFFLVGALIWVAVAPTVPVAIIGLIFMGATSTTVVIRLQASLQLQIPDDMSGRILALYSVAFAGSKPLGGVIGGLLIDFGGPRLVFGLGAIAIGIATTVLLGRRRSPRLS